MSVSLKNARMERSISAASAFPLFITPSNASSASSPQCHVSSKGFNLGARPFAGGTLKKDIVSGLAVERRIEINEVNAFIVDGVLHDGQVVAVI